jgi:hypothetical protein
MRRPVKETESRIAAEIRAAVEAEREECAEHARKACLARAKESTLHVERNFSVLDPGQRNESLAQAREAVLCGDAVHEAIRARGQEAPRRLCSVSGCSGIDYGTNGREPGPCPHAKAGSHDHAR